MQAITYDVILYLTLQNGRIYMVDYKILEGIPCYEKRYVCPSMGLFYVKDSRDLVPIAIQLYQKPSAENPIWTPNDAEMDWICAKLWLRNSDGQFHQVSIKFSPTTFEHTV